LKLVICYQVLWRFVYGKLFSAFDVVW